MMGSFSAWHWILVAIVVLLLFGRGKISEFMGDAAKGIKAFKKGMAEDDVPAPPPAPPAATPPSTTIDHHPVAPQTPETAAAQPSSPAQAPKAS
jgi:sec-independent protein translocase protein TatA